jgi:hypothetical protein
VSVCVCVVRSYGDLSSVDGFPRAGKNLDDSNANRDSISKP